jgi:hypothetical protein
VLKFSFDLIPIKSLDIIRMQLQNDKKHCTTYLSPNGRGAHGETLSLASSRMLPVELFDNGDWGKNWVLRGDGYSIHVADSPGKRNEARALIQRMYAQRGYHVQNAAVTSHNPNRLTLVAFNAQKLIGTVTLGIDSDDGLLADELYAREINVFRSKGVKVCELSKFALDPEHSSKEILGALFHLTYIYASRIFNAQDAVIEVNPRHSGFYQRMLGFRRIGETRICPRVNAPALLLHLELDYMHEQICCLGGSRETKEKSLYPYFFSMSEEEGLIRKLRKAH